MSPGDLIKKPYHLNSVRCFTNLDCSDWDYFIDKNVVLVLGVERAWTNLQVCKVLVPTGVRYVYSMDVERCEPVT